ncbi:MAG: methyltransferase domain-containing protein [Proteobacteria bacterium]|nr:methyltransferase domain-containing protein [Pseudomonadota bacterium]
MTWYKDDELWQRFYSCMFDAQSFKLAEQQIPEVLSLVQHNVNDVLDLGCGPGRHCLALAKMGFNVVGVDTSHYLLSRAKEQSHDFSIDYIQADMLTFSKPCGFDLIINMFNSFGYFDNNKKNQQVLDNAFINLNSTGTFIIDTVGKETLARTIEPVHLSEYDNGDIRIERPVLIDNMQVFANQWILISGDSVFKRSYQHYVYTPVELSQMCYQAGFDQVDCYGSLAGDDYDLDSDRLVVVARKLRV